MEKGIVKVVVKTTSYMYHGHTYGNGATILMDQHDVAPAVDRGQIRIEKAVKKTVPKTTKKKQKKGPDSNRATGPSENREG